jgi:hypothetical protein
MRNFSDKLCEENRDTHFMLKNFFFENHTVYEIMWKHFRAGQATDDNVARAHCMLDTESYTRSEYVIVILRVLLS